MSMYHIATVAAVCGIAYAAFLWTAMNNAAEWVDAEPNLVPASGEPSAIIDAIEPQPVLPAAAAA